MDRMFTFGVNTAMRKFDFKSYDATVHYSFLVEDVQTIQQPNKPRSLIVEAITEV